MRHQRAQLQTTLLFKRRSLASILEMRHVSLHLMGLPEMEAERVARQRKRLVGLQALDVPWGGGGDGEE